MQARAWRPATEALLDHVGLAPGGSCLDVGCGPGETMRLMAERIRPGPAGWSVWIGTPMSARPRSTAICARPATSK